MSSRTNRGQSTDEEKMRKEDREYKEKQRKEAQEHELRILKLLSQQQQHNYPRPPSTSYNQLDFVNDNTY